MTLMWATATTDEFDEWFAKLGDDEKVEVIAKQNLLKTFGPLLKRPHADTLNGSRYSNLKELRGKTSGAVLRIAFAFDPLQTAILLCGGDKSGVSEKKFYTNFIEKADKLYAHHLKRVKKRKAELKRAKGRGDKNG